LLEFGYEPFSASSFSFFSLFLTLVYPCAIAQLHFRRHWYFEQPHLFRTWSLHETVISRAPMVRLMDQSWHRARLRAIRRQLFGASTFHRDSDGYRWLARFTQYVQTIQVCGIYFTFCHIHVSSVKHNQFYTLQRNTLTE